MRDDDYMPIGMIESTERWPGAPRRVEAGGAGGANAAAPVAPKVAPVQRRNEVVYSFDSNRCLLLARGEESVRLSPEEVILLLRFLGRVLDMDLKPGSD